MRSHHTIWIGMAVAVGALAAGCSASPGSSSASAPASSPALSASPSVSSPEPTESPVTSEPPDSAGPAPLPTITKPSKPPREPTDNLPETGWVAGMVTRGGAGPCYGITADDGTRYALYSADGINLTAGARVKVKLETTLLKIYCGPGALMAMTEAEPIG